MVPILVRSIQELKTEITELQNNSTSSNLQKAKSSTEDISSISKETALYQNAPNPFSESTTITCYINDDANEASLYIYDMTGKQIDKKVISDKGDVSIKIEAGSLTAGMYIYSLVVDDKVIDSKRMILTK